MTGLQQINMETIVIFWEYFKITHTIPSKPILSKLTVRIQI